MFEEEWFPKANSIGVGWNDFWKTNPRIIRLLLNGHTEKQKQEVKIANALFHLQGQYFAQAINSTVGNMFKKKGSKPHEYPQKPFDIGSQKDLSEEELQLQREAFMAGLLAMKANYELNHEDSKGS